MDAEPEAQTDADTEEARRKREALKISEHVGKIVSDIRLIATNLRAYAPDHPSVKSSAEQMVKNLDGALEDRDELDVNITMSGMEYRTVPLYDVAELVKDLVGICQRKKIGRMAFKKGATEEEAISFVNVLWKADKSDVEVEAIAKKLEKLEVTHLAVERADFEEDELDKLDKEKKEAKPKKGPQIDDPKVLYRTIVELVKEMTAQASLDAEMDTHNLDAIARDITLFIGENRFSLLPFASLRRHAPYQYAHPVNVCFLVSTVVSTVVTDSNELPEFVKAALLYNIGQAFVPDEAILKSSGFTDDEKKAIRRHPLRGAQAVDKIEGLSKVNLVTAFEHHLGHDFSGYPTVKYRWHQSFLTSLIVAADRYDTLTTKRGDTAALCPGEALQQMEKEVGTTLDPAAFTAIAAVLGQYPLGSLVELNTSEMAVVTSKGSGNGALGVRVIADKESRLLDKPERCEVPVAETADAPRFIRRAIDANSVPVKVVRYL